ncbi:MAG: bile acid:sodium symporter family protein [Woeseiaceae bacterium]
MDIATLDNLKIILDPIGQIGIAIALMLIMFSIALGLSTKDFIFLFQRRVLFAVGVVTQVAGLPLLTLLLIHLISPPPSIALGMFVVACCPGGAVSNLFTYLSRGNVAYSVSLTAMSSALAAVFTPVSILFWSQTYKPTSDLLQSLEFNAIAFLLQTTVLLVIPLVLGMLIAARSPDIALRLRKKMALAGSLILIAAIAYGTAKFFDLLFPALPLLASITIAHNALAFSTGALVALLLRADKATHRALTFEIGIQNSGLAIVILIGQFSGLGGAAAIAAVWGIWHIIAGGFIVILFRRLDRLRVTA